METHLLLFAALLIFFSLPSQSTKVVNNYIVQLRPPENVDISNHKLMEGYFNSFLPNTSGSAGDQSRMIHTYQYAMCGFAARLTKDEVDEMSKKAGFLNARPSRVLNMLTTHTPNFLGLSKNPSSIWGPSRMGKGTIIGIIDSGITPQHISFHDGGIGAPPSKWKGTCKDLKPIDGKCNNKLIGARDFVGGGGKSVIDTVGHGTHTASTAAGNFVPDANVLGNGNGISSGMAPLAHLAVYKVCDQRCNEFDVLSGMNAAIADGVDVMSISLGFDHQLPLYADYIAIASFTAASKGIFVSAAAGNSGPVESTVINQAPWVLTVAAGTMDRSLKAVVKLGDDQEFEGQSAFQPTDFPSFRLPLTYPISPGYKDNNCLHENLTPDIKGKVVLCHNNNAAGIDIGYNVHKHGGAAMILINGENAGYTTLAEAHVLPASNVNYADATKILSYFKSSTNATATIMFQGTIVGKSEAPAVAAFSSRGPSVKIPGVLKPDILAPGVNLVAAWPFTVGPKPKDLTNKGFNIIAGTSMATPHLSGIAALLKVLHPGWSPAAIKSAIMTTATTKDNCGKPILDENHHSANYFMMGAGHVNPSKAADPGLVFDIDTKDYIAFLCGMGYNDKQVRDITRDDTQCAKMEKISQSGLNYPSIITSRGKHVVVKRTVTNVGEAPSTYKVIVDLPKEVIVEVTPNVLEFHKLNEKKSFEVTINSNAQLKESIHGNLKWVSNKYTVRMPIIVH